MIASAVTLLPDTGFADEAETVSRADVETDIADNGMDAVVGAEFDVEVADGDKRGRRGSRDFTGGLRLRRHLRPPRPPWR